MASRTAARCARLIMNRMTSTNSASVRVVGQSRLQTARLTQAALGIAMTPVQQAPVACYSVSAVCAATTTTSTAGAAGSSSPAAAGAAELEEEGGEEEGSDRMPRPSPGDPPDPGSLDALTGNKSLAETRQRFVSERFDMMKRPDSSEVAELPGDAHSIYGPLEPSDWQPLGNEGLVVADRKQTAGSAEQAQSKAGEPVPGDYVKLHLVGRLEDGTVVDDHHSPESGSALHVLWMTRQMVIGLELGLQGMRVGDRRTVRVPPHLGYGFKKMEKMGVPRNAVLLYDVELLAVGDEAEPPPKSLFEQARELLFT